MASTYQELYADFIQAIKSYTEQLVVTEVQFMRYLTRGQQKFQMKVELLNKAVIANDSGTYPYYSYPPDLLRLDMVVEVDEDGHETNRVLRRSIEQSQRESKEIPLGTSVQTRRWDMLLNPRYSGYAGFTRGVSYSSNTYTIIDNGIILSGERPPAIAIYYIPDIPAFASPDPNQLAMFNYWDDWYPIDDITKFIYKFQNSRIKQGLDKYESAFVDYAIYEYLLSINNGNAKFYLDNFTSEVMYAIQQKPTAYSNLYRHYSVSPYS